MTDKPGVWVEFLSDPEVRSALPAVAPHLGRIHLSISTTRFFSDEFAALTRQAKECGLDVYLWPLFPIERGYWLGEHNAAELQEVMQGLLRWRDAPGGPSFDGVSFDLEPGHAYAERLRTSKLHRLPTLLIEHVDPAAFERARLLFARALDTLHQGQLRAHAVAFPLVLDDAPGDRVLEDALDTPVSDLDWDEVSFMVYQTAFTQLAGLWFGPSLVAAYAQAAVARFGERAGLDLGVVGGPALGLDAGDRYPDPTVLAADLAAAHGAGIPYAQIRVYGLAGLLEEGGAGRWLGQLPPCATPAISQETTGLRAGIQALSRALKAAT
ncbi:MAG TPA: hypothetical protein PKA88_23985 [Polyangiaceae bacterium]|nr:hypothetical protein [Polyangiaceae bacterium]